MKGEGKGKGRTKEGKRKGKGMTRERQRKGKRTAREGDKRESYYSHEFLPVRLWDGKAGECPGDGGCWVTDGGALEGHRWARLNGLLDEAVMEDRSRV